MPKAKLYNVEGKMVGERELAADVFGVAVKPELVHEVNVGLAANARKPFAHTKTKGEVRGGGKKPWRQKGTGRARQGSTRNPQWIGGGVAFGPRSDRDYTKKINTKTKRRALLMTLSDKAANERLVLVEQLTAKDGKTKAIAGLLGKLPVKGKLMLVSGTRDEMLSRGTRNLQNVNLTRIESLDLRQVLSSDYLVLTPETTEKMEKLYGRPDAPAAKKVEKPVKAKAAKASAKAPAKGGKA